jgi:Fe2+ or Zn2+ uptake regulation protein
MYIRRVKTKQKRDLKSGAGKHWVICSACGRVVPVNSENFATLEDKFEPHSVASYYCMRTVVSVILLEKFW